MDFEQLITSILASFIIMVRRIIFLIISPYKTMRAISQDTDIIQAMIILSGIVIYFFAANRFRSYEYHPALLSFITILHIMGTMLFFALFTRLSTKQNHITMRPFMMLFSYALIPTLMWFMVNSWLFVLIPPPRTFSILGKGFSILYMSFSVALLAWKMILMYLAIRYATGFQFFRIVYSLFIYLAIIIPYWLLLYSFGLFRVPFL